MPVKRDSLELRSILPLTFQVMRNANMTDITHSESIIEGERIEWLTKNKLHKVAVNSEQWKVLYQDPSDKRYWLLMYPQSSLHGGGPPVLKVISAHEAKEVFGV